MTQVAIACISFFVFCLFPLESYSAPDGCEIEIISTWELEGKGSVFGEGCWDSWGRIKNGEETCRCAEIKITNVSGSQFRVRSIGAYFPPPHQYKARAKQLTEDLIIQPGQSQTIKDCFESPAVIKNITCDQVPVQDSDNSSQEEPVNQELEYLESDYQELEDQEPKPVYQKPAYQQPATKAKIRQLPDGSWTN